MTPHDYKEIMNHFLVTVRKYDPVGYENLAKNGIDELQEPKMMLISYLKSYIYIEKTRSNGVHTAVVNKLNEYVKTKNGMIIKGVQMTLTSTEQELCGTDMIDLTPTVDNSKFIEALFDLFDELHKDRGSYND